MKILEHYNDELRQLRESGAQFAKEHPQVAARLGLHPDEVTDPFVERLLEGVAFLSARVHSRLDHECSEFAQQALLGLSPLYMTAMPSMSVFSFHPDYESPESFSAKTIKRGTVVQSQIKARKQPVLWVTARDVHLMPLNLVSAQCARGFNEIPQSLSKKLSTAQGLVRLRFELEGTSLLRDIKGSNVWQPLHLSLAGDLPTAYALHRLLMADTEQLFAHFPDDGSHVELPIHSLRMAGLDDDQSLLPLHSGGQHGLRLLREYFSHPERYLGIDLKIMAILAAFRGDARSFDLVFKLKRAPEDLMGVVSSRQFRLFATPVMNLYSKRLDPVNFDARKTDQWLPVDRMQPQGHYLWAIDEVHVCYKNGKIEKAQASIDSVAFDDDHRQARYGFRRREAGLMLGTRHDVVDPLASHDTISLSLQGTNKSVEEVTTVLVKAWVTDRAWSPKALLDAPLTLQDAHAVARIECLWAGSMPRPVPTMEVCWEAVSCLSANPLAMSRPGRQDITAQIVNYIRQATHADHALDRQRLSSVRSVHIRTGHVRARRHSPMAWVRCMHLDMDIDSAHHADQGAWLFGRVLAQALSEYISLNDGIEVRIFLDGELSSVHSNTHREDGVLE